MITANKNHGPVYGVELIDSLPLGTGIMTQAMPSRQDLANVRRVDGGERVAAGYEVLLSHYRNAMETIQQLKAGEP